MEKNKSTETVALVGALLAGVAIGATIGILFAPDKGSETRKRLKNEAIPDDLEAKMNDVLDAFRKEFENAKEKLSDIAEKGKEAAVNAKDAVKEKVEKA